MRHAFLKFGAIAGVAGALALATVTPSVAAPVSTGAAALNSAVASDAASSDVVNVRWRGRYGYYGGAFVGGLALGALAARPYYYGYDPYYYGPPPAAVYGPPPGPVYSQPYPDPNGATRQCWVSTDKDRGYGYFRPC